jgi:catechol 2,3-dioxygenase-like lactoylglutathione lyase family enzyme
MTGVRPKALDHVGLKVSDMDRSQRFYCEGTSGRCFPSNGAIEAVEAFKYAQYIEY